MGITLYSVDDQEKTLTPLLAKRLADMGLTEPRDLEGWLANSGTGLLFGRRALWLARQDHPSDEQRSDLVGLDANGDLLVVELKRGEVAQDAVVQVLCYAAEYAEKDASSLAELYAAHALKQGESALVADVKSVQEAAKRIEDHAGPDTELNEVQVVVLVGEEFSASTLSVCHYLNEASGDATFSIECWLFTVFENTDGRHLFALEQIVPAPEIRDAIEQRRADAKCSRYARNPARKTFLADAYGYFRSSGMDAQRSQGASYECRLYAQGTSRESYATFSVHHEKPRIILTRLRLSGGLEDLDATATEDRDGRTVIEFAGANPLFDPFGTQLGERVCAVIHLLQPLCDVEQQPGPVAASEDSVAVSEA